MPAWPETLMATHSGLRGRPHLDLTPAVIRRAVGGLLAVLAERGAPASIGVARDARPEGLALAEAVMTAAVEAGADVVDFGAISTPTAKLAARRRGLGGAVVVTGSHLAPELNGLKLVAGPAYEPLDPRRLPEAEARGARRGQVRGDDGAAHDHAEAVCAAVDADVLRRAALGVECRGGAGRAAALALERLGCRIGTGRPDAILELDADGDRLALVDERGDALESDDVLALAVLARDARSVVKGADTSRGVDDVLAARGGAVLVVPPGELHLVRALRESGAELGGEGNGGVVVPEVGLARDGLAVAALILEWRAREGRPLSDLAAELPRYVRRRSAVACSPAAPAAPALQAVAARLGAAVPIDPEVGVRVERPDAWGLLRRSATEPVLRITAEARTEAAAAALHAELRDAVLDALAAE